MGTALIHSVSVAEFDELKGNILSYIYPNCPVPRITSHKMEDIAELCLPDGGHKHSSDAIYMLLTGEGNIPLYGFAYFRNRPDEKEKRGARQLALLLITTQPHFDRFRPFLSVAMEQYLDNNEDLLVIQELHTALDTSIRRARHLARGCYPSISDFGNGKECGKTGDTYTNGNSSSSGNGSKSRDHVLDDYNSDESIEMESLNLFESNVRNVQSNGNMGLLTSNKTCTMHLWGKMFVMQPLIPLQANEFGGTSLKGLVLKFRIQTMTLWTSLLSLKRVLFCSPESTADAVGSLVLATPLLLGSLGMLIIPNLVPYVTLANVDPVTTRTSYVCGTTNSLFATKKAWYDVLADSSNGKVTWESDLMEEKMLAKVVGKDLSFIHRVIEGIENNRDENWTRNEFAEYTTNFLSSVWTLENKRVTQRSNRNSCSSITMDSNSLINATNTLSGVPEPPYNTNAGGGKLSHLKAQFLKKKHIKASSERIAQTFAGSPLWLRYRWMQLNPESFNPSQRRSAQAHAIEPNKDCSGPAETRLEPPVLPKRPTCWMTFAADPSKATNGMPPSTPPGRSNSPNNRESISGLSLSSTSSATSMSTVSTLGSALLEKANSKNKPSVHVQNVASGVASKRATISAADDIDGTIDNSSSTNGNSGEMSREERSKWRNATSPEGIKYWWNLETKEARWNLPGENPVRPPQRSNGSDASKNNESTSGCCIVNSKALQTQQQAQLLAREVKQLSREVQQLSQETQLQRQANENAKVLGKSSSDSSFCSNSSSGSGGSAIEDTSVPMYNTSPKWVLIQGKYQKVNCVVIEDYTTRVQKPSDWIEVFTSKKERYYWNIVSGESAWLIPASAGLSKTNTISATTRAC